MGRYFGTDGFRGRVGVTLAAEHAYLIGRCLGQLQRGGRVLIGQDTRLSGEMLACALSAGLAASGAQVHLLGVATTACVSYLTHMRGYDLGVMLSASHNPYHDNGIKLFGANGEKLSDTLTQCVEDYLDAHASVSAAPAFTASPCESGRITRTHAQRDYVHHLLRQGCCPLGRVRIGLDCAHGSACRVASEVFTALGASVVATGVTPNGTNINRGVGSTHIEHLTRLVRTRHLDIGFAFDGDADRCIAVDERGEVVDGDGILYLSALDMQTRNALPGNLTVGTVLSGGGTEAALGRAGITLLRAPVGDRHVYTMMKTHGAALGGEPSGHVIYADDAVTGDGILTAIKVLGIVARRGCPLSHLTQGMERYPRVELNIPADHPAALLASPRVQNAVREVQARLSGQARLLVRASGTEPLLRVMCEGEDASLCRTCAEEIALAARATAGGA